MEIRKRRRLFTVDEYEQMSQAGVFRTTERVELIRGEIVEMSPIGVEHAGRLARLIRVLPERLRGQALLWPQNPLRIHPHSMPEPDLILLRPRADDYCSAYPTPEDVLVIIEIADSSLSWDRGVKGRLYAESGVKEYWIVNLKARVIEIRESPTAEGYSLIRRIRSKEIIESSTFPGLGFTVEDLLGE